MKYYIVFLLWYSLLNIGLGQNISMGQVDYYYTNGNFSLYGIEGEATLYFNRDKFYFKSYTVPQLDKITEEGMEIDFERGDRYGFPIITDLKDKKTHSRISISEQSAQLIEPLLEWDWQLIDSIKTIEGFKCFLAKGKREDKIFMAWYCPEINSLAGPKYLWGLPGLILEASSIDGDENYYLKSLKISNGIDFLIEVPKTKIVFNNFCEYLTRLKKLRDQTDKEFISKGKLPIDWRELDEVTGFKKMLEYEKNCF